MINDAQLAKLASERNFTPLADAFGVKLAAAYEMKEEVKLRAFVEKMASYGFHVSNDAELEQLLQTGRMIEAHLEKEAKSEEGNSLYKAAGEHLSWSLGIDSPEANASQYQALQSAADKVSQHMLDPSVAMHMLALSEAESVASA